MTTQQVVQKQHISSTRISFTGLLTIVFIALKLMHYIDWSWWWVLVLLWAPVALLAAIFAIAGLVLLAIKLADMRGK